MGKEKGGFLTPKAIANRIKAKGLQKLRWYCQMCQKQCRDEVKITYWHNYEKSVSLPSFHISQNYEIVLYIEKIRGNKISFNYYVNWCANFQHYETIYRKRHKLCYISPLLVLYQLLAKTSYSLN